MNSEVAIIKDNLLSLSREILKLTSYKPSRKTNQHFSDLVTLVSQRHHYEQTILSHGDIDSIRNELPQACAKSEFEMEQYWAKKIIGALTVAGAYRRLRAFWYYGNYDALTEFEFGLLQRCGYYHSHIPTMIFVGGGPLPLTPILARLKYGIRSIVIDSDEQAVSMARRVVQKLSLSSMIDIRHASGETYDAYHDADIIVVAALAGIDPKQKESILDQVGRHASSDACIIIRSATGLRTLLYPSVDIHTEGHFHVLVHEDPSEHLINSAYICRRR